MKGMKRSIAFVLVVLMTIASVPFSALSVGASETEGEYIYAGTSATAVIAEDGSYAEFYFIPETSGVYTLYSTSDEDTRAYLYNVDGVILSENDDGGYGNNFNLSYCFTEGETYIFSVGFYSGTSGSFQIALEKSPIVSVSVEGAKAFYHDNGYYQKDVIWDSEREENVEVTYFYYYAPSPSNVTVTMENGEEIVFDGNSGGFDWNGVWYGLSYWTEQNYDNRWDLGNNTAYGSIGSVEFTYDVEIIESPVASVEIQNVAILENENGYYRTDEFWNPETEQWELTPEYFYYYFPFPNGENQCKITLKDGTVVYDTRVEWEGNVYYFNTINTQNYENRWTLGTNTASAKILGYEFTYDFEIVTSPVASIYVEPAVCFENENGYYYSDEYWNEETESWEFTPEYFVYSVPSPNNYVITMVDGTVYENETFNWNGSWYSLQVYHDQSYENQWGVGKHTATVSICGYETDYVIEIVDSPVESIAVEPITVIKNTRGYFTTDNYYDEELGMWVNTPEYFYYYVPHPEKYTVTLKDGTVFENTRPIWNGEQCDFSIYSDQSYNNQWSVGMNEVTGSIAGYEFTYDVEIIESPVVSIEYDPIVILENTNGYYRYDEYWDDELQQIVVTPEYYCYYLPWINGLRITLIDGTVIEDTDGFEWNGEFFSMNRWAYQDYDNQWKVGINKIYASIAGYETEFDAEVIKTPIVSVEIKEPITIREETHCWPERGENWDEELGMYVPYEYTRYEMQYPQCIVTLSDGTVYEGNSFTWNGIYFSLNVYNDQSYETPWKLGKNTVNASFGGFEFTYDVEIIETPVASVEVTVSHIAENTRGRWKTDNVWDNELEKWVETPEYYLYTDFWPSQYVITLKDGTVYRNSGFNWDGVYYSLSIGSDQSYDNQWTLGKNTATGTVCGYKFNYDVEIVKESVNDQFEYLITSEGIIITDCFIYNEETLEFPAEIDGLPVVGITSLGGYYEGIKHLIIPDSVRTIGDYLIESFPLLETVTFGKGVANLSPQMFIYNRYLKNIYVNEENEYFCVKDNVLYDEEMTTFIAIPRAAGFESYVVPKTVVEIEALFYSCYSKIELSFEDGHALYVTVDGVTYNTEMTKVEFCSKSKEGSYVMPDSVTEIAEQAFMDCEGLTDVVVSKNVTEIIYGTFASCRNLKSVELPSGLIAIEMYAFQDTTSLESIELPDTLAYIGSGAFRNSGLTAVTIPDSVELIGHSAFFSTNITTLDLGSGVKEIGSYAFAETPVKAVVLPDSLEYVSYNAFYYCRELEALEIGSGLTTIEQSTFAGTAIKNLIIPENIEYIGDSAFSNSAITSVVFENPAVFISDYAFANCPIDSLTLGSELQYIGEYTFAGAEIKKIDIPDSVTAIVYGAFYNCESLAEINMPDSVKMVGGHVFENTAWYNAQPDGLTYLNHVLYDWKGSMDANTTVIIKDGIKVIADYAFEEQCNMTEIVLPDSLERIGNYVFYGCEGLTSVHIPANLREIGESAFLGCMSLKEITVDPENEYFYVENGALYTTDGYMVYDTNMEYELWDAWIMEYPYKDQYYVGEEFDPEGLVLILYYRGGYRKFVTEGFEFSDFDSSQPGEYRVEIIYGEYSTGFWINVYEKTGTDPEPDPDIPDNPDKVAGDVDGDGITNAIDANILRRYLAGSYSDINIDNSDLNGDGRVDPIDANLMKRLLAGSMN